MPDECDCARLANILPATDLSLPDHICADSAKLTCAHWLEENWPYDDDPPDWFTPIFKIPISSGLSIECSSPESYPLQIAGAEGFVQVVIRQWVEEKEQRLAEALAQRPEWKEAPGHNLAELGLPATPSTEEYLSTGASSPSRGLLVTTFCLTPEVYGVEGLISFRPEPSRPHRRRPESFARIEGSSSYLTDSLMRTAAKTVSRHAKWWKQQATNIWNWPTINNLRVLNRGTQGSQYERDLAEQVVHNEITVIKARKLLRIHEEKANGRPLSDTEQKALHKRFDERIRRLKDSST